MKHSGKSDERVFGEGGALNGHFLLFVSRISLTAKPASPACIFSDLQIDIKSQADECPFLDKIGRSKLHSKKVTELERVTGEAENSVSSVPF
jgi:hypothetical protein